MTLSRRCFLKTAGACTALPLFAPRIALSADPSQERDILICLFLRGGADALNVIVPYGDGFYYDHRPTLAIPEPGQAGGALDLDGFFGLHPAMEALMDPYQRGDLALIQATGSPHETRSHFTAQDLMERGYLQEGGIFTGWIARHLAQVQGLTASASAFRAVGAGGVVQTALRGEIPATAIASFEGFNLQVRDDQLEAVSQQLLALYGGSDPLALQGQQAMLAIADLNLADPGQYPPENGALYPESALGQTLLQVGQLIKAETLGVEAVCLDAGGWDTHNGQAAVLGGLLADLAASLAAFYTDMGSRMSRISVVTMSEFGRRAFENGSAGTDHGHGGFMFALGGGVNGGLYTDWQGLAPNQLYDGRDLQVTIDWRTVLGELADKRLANNDLATLFPDYAMPGPVGVFSRRGL